MAVNKVGLRHAILLGSSKDKDELSDGNLSPCYSDDEKQADILLRQGTCGDTVLDENTRKQVQAFRCEHTREELENATKELIHRNYPRACRIDRQKLEKEFKNNNALHPSSTSDLGAQNDDLSNPAVWQSIVENMNHWDPYQRYTIDTRFVPEQYRELVDSLTCLGSVDAEAKYDEEDTHMLLKSNSEIEENQIPKNETLASIANVRERNDLYAEEDKTSGGDVGQFRQDVRLAENARSPRRKDRYVSDTDRVTSFIGKCIANAPSKLSEDRHEETDNNNPWQELISKWSPLVEIPTRDFEVINTKPDASKRMQEDIVPVLHETSLTKSRSETAKKSSVWDCLLCK